MNWAKKVDVHADRPMRDPASAAKRFPELHGADPVTALNDLSGRLDKLKAVSGLDESARNHSLSLIQESGGPHLCALLTQFVVNFTDEQATREANWNGLSNYQKALTAALCTSARLLLNQAATNSSLHHLAAAGAARGLDACRTLAKICLVRYLSIPPKLWQVAYAIHGDAEKAGCAALPVCMHAGQKTQTSVTQELLRLLMLQSSAPDMMAPEQIEVADRVIAQLGAEFTLRPQGATDGTFCFLPAGDRPPHRVAGSAPETSLDIRYFGPGAGFSTLERLYKQFITGTITDVLTIGKDITSHIKISVLQHLLAFWGATTPYVPPARSTATGTLHVVHRYSGIWRQISRVRSGAIELSLAEDGEGPPQAPEAWTLLNAGGNELDAEISRQSYDRARCGDIVAVLIRGDEECWLGVIRSMHADPGHGVRATIAILSRDPQAVELRVLVGKNEDSLYSEETARQFGFNLVHAIILPVDAAVSQAPTLLLPPESWREGRVYEATTEGPARHLRSGRLMRRGDDYVRVAFEWVSLEPAS